MAETNELLAQTQQDINEYGNISVAFNQ